MSQIEKLLIPLIDENITVKDVNVQDFVGVYTEDINSPSSDFLYLVYHYDINNMRKTITKNSIDYVRRIGDALYHIYKFPIISTNIKKILSGNYSNMSTEGISKIHTFWKDIDDVTANYPFYRTLAGETYHRAIPEETYIPLCKKKEPRGFTVERQ